MSRRNRGKVNIPICVAAVLLFLTLLSTHLCSGLYARYTTTASGSDSARVARFEIEDGTVGTWKEDVVISELRPSESAVESMTCADIVNKSEVAVAVTLNVENVYDNLPLKFVLLQNDKVVAGPADEMADLTYNVAPNDKTPVKLGVYWPQNETNLEFRGRVDLLRLTVRVEQID